MRLRLSDETTRDALASMRRRYGGSEDPGRWIRVNVKVSFLGEHLLAARINDTHTLIADEPAEFGGFGAAPAPLYQFVAGFALSESSQYIWHIADMELDIEDIELEVNTENAWTPVLPENTQYTSELGVIAVTVRLTSSEPAERIRELAARVARGGPAHNSLVRPLEITSNLVVNGRPIN